MLGAFFLGELDAALEPGRIFHLRFMDDMLVLTAPDLQKHPGKTFIGRIEKGFDWLGYHLCPNGLRLAAKPSTIFRPYDSAL